MKIEKDGIEKELADEFMLADFLQAWWKKLEEKPLKNAELKKENK